MDEREQALAPTPRRIRRRSLSLGQFPGWRAGWEPIDRRPSYVWAKDGQVYLNENYAIEGFFDVSLSRYLMAPMDAITLDDLVREVHICGAVQTAKSLILEICIPWIMANDPGPLMWTFQSDPDAKEHMLTRAMPLWDSIPALKGIWPLDRHKRTPTAVYFGSSFFLANGANKNNLQSKSIRWKFNSELWLPQWQDLYTMAVRRVSAYARQGRSKVVNDSQSGNKNDVMDTAVRSGDFSRWSAPCLNCRDLLPLRMAQKEPDGLFHGMVWADDVKRQDGTYNESRAIETVRWRCRCGHEMPDTPETRSYWNRTGLYVPENPTAPREIRSFWWSSVHVHPMRFLAKEKAEALNMAHRGNLADLKTYKQQRENEPWEEQHLTVNLSDAKSGYLLAEYANGEKFPGEMHRAIMLDRQQGMAGDVPHYWVEARAYFHGGGSRQIYFDRLNQKENVRELQKRLEVPDRCVWQDANFDSDKVFRDCVEFGWVAVMTKSKRTSWAHRMRDPKNKSRIVEVLLPYSNWKPHEVPGTTKRAMCLEYSENYMADILGNLVSGRGVPWEQPEDVNPAYIKHLQNEHKVEKRPGVWAYEKVHSTAPNHGWDTSKQHVCFATVMRLMAMPVAVPEGETLPPPAPPE